MKASHFPLPSVVTLSVFALLAEPGPEVRAAEIVSADSVRKACGPMRAVRLAESVSIDGKLDEPVWQNGHAITKFTQRDPNEGAPPSQRTEVRLAYDDDAVYVGARLFDSAPDSILARLSRRDESVPADRFSFYLDPQHDRRSGYYFLINAAGTLFDGTLSNDGWEDASWDGVWEGKARRDSLGWTCEMKIPYSQLRFANQGAEVLWGVNFRRRIERRSEELFVVYQPKKESGFVSRFPDLVGMENVKPQQSIELLPYVTGKAAYESHSSGDPFHDGSAYEPNAGFDLRTSLGSRLTLNGTVNPDFGQVEVDPAVVNLSDVETFYPEKRPFFVEGSSNFRFGNEGANNYWGFNWPEPVFFYSRRIGRAPQGSWLDSTYADAPSGTTILGAAKLTGKLAPSWNFGTLSAITGEEHANFSGGGPTATAEIEPPTYWGVARVQKEFPDRRYGLGAMANAAVRNLSSSRLIDEYNKTSLMTGLDGWVFLDPKKTWVVSGWSAMSTVWGTPNRMLGVQENSLHYFQRPDAGHLTLDPEATSMTGYGSRLWINRQSGSMIMNSAIGFMTPKFDVNDVGFMTRADVINSHLGGGYKWTETTKTRKYQEVLGALFGSWDFDGNRTSTGIWASGYTEFINNYSWDYRTAYNPQTMDVRRTRGGPRMLRPQGFELGTYFDTDGKSKMFYFLDTGGYVQPTAGAGSYNYWFFPGIEWKPASNLLLRLGPGYEQVREDAQYVATIGDPLQTETYGARYMMAVLDQRTISANIRLNCAFSPTLSLQFFGQPLISTGDYSDYKELARPATYDFNVYGQNATEGTTPEGVEFVEVDPDGPGGPATPFVIENPDFRFVSMRGNAVLRWEFRPGSAFYLVWSHDASGQDYQGSATFGPSMNKLFSTDADDVFLAKVTWYLNL